MASNIDDLDKNLNSSRKGLSQEIGTESNIQDKTSRILP